MRFVTAMIAMAAMGACLGLAPRRAAAQSWDELETYSAPPASAQADQAVDPDAVSGPTIYVVDKQRHLATINLGTKTVTIIGLTPATLTDIAFNPKNHQLYGVSFTTFYLIDKATGLTTTIGSLGVSDANSLVFNSNGVPYSAGVNSAELYRIDLRTGAATVVGPTNGYKSAGDLTFYNDHLILSGFQQDKKIGRTTPIYLLTLDPSTGLHVGPAIQIPVFDCFGLVSTGKNELYGLGVAGEVNAALFRIFPAQKSYGKRAMLLENLTNRGLGQILGAAYDGNFQP